MKPDIKSTLRAIATEFVPKHQSSTLRAIADEFVPKQQPTSVTKEEDLALAMTFQKWKLVPKKFKETRFKSPNSGKIMVPAHPKKNEPFVSLNELLKEQAGGKTGLCVKIAKIYNDRAAILLKEGEAEGSDHNAKLALEQLERDRHESHESAKAAMKLLLDRQSKGEKGLALQIASLANGLEANFLREKNFKEAEEYSKITRHQIVIDELESTSQMEGLRKAFGISESSLPAPKPVDVLPSQLSLKMSYLEAFTKEQTSSSLVSQPQSVNANVSIAPEVTKTSAVLQLERDRMGDESQGKTIV